MTKDIYTKDEIRQMICTKIDNKETNNVAYLRYELYKHKVGDTITITYERDGKEKTVKVKLASNGEKM